MKSIGAGTVCLSVLILLTALSNNDSRAEAEMETTTVQTTSSGVSNPSTDIPSNIPAHTTHTDHLISTILTTQSNDSFLNGTQHEAVGSTAQVARTATPQPTLTGAYTQQWSVPADNETKIGTEALTKVSTTTDQNHHANASSLGLTNVILPTINSTHATQKAPTDGNIKVNSTDGQGNVLKTPTNHKDDGKDKVGEEESATSKSKKGIIGVGCVLAAIVFVVLIFLYKMCQNKPPAAENSEIKARSAQTKESVKLLSVKTATPYSGTSPISAVELQLPDYLYTTD